MTIQETIIKTAESFVGQEEIAGNLGFKEQEFLELMQAVGWNKGDAWCAYFTELVWKLSFIHDQTTVRELNLLFSAGVMATWNNFRRSDWLTDQQAYPGAVAIFQTWKNGQPHWSGHCGIVTELLPTGFECVEGNTNNNFGREGLYVLSRIRSYSFSVTSGLRLIGFIHPKKPLV